MHGSSTGNVSTDIIHLRSRRADHVTYEVHVIIGYQAFLDISVSENVELALAFLHAVVPPSLQSTLLGTWYDLRATSENMAKVAELSLGSRYR